MAAMESGASVEKTGRWGCYQIGPLLVTAASKNTNPQVITLLFQPRANLSDRNEGGITLLTFAACNTNPKITEILLQAGAVSLGLPIQVIQRCPTPRAAQMWQ